MFTNFVMKCFALSKILVYMFYISYELFIYNFINRKLVSDELVFESFIFQQTWQKKHILNDIKQNCHSLVTAQSKIVSILQNLDYYLVQFYCYFFKNVLVFKSLLKWQFSKKYTWGLFRLKKLTFITNTYKTTFFYKILYIFFIYNRWAI